jgi:hypothetical protein
MLGNEFLSMWLSLGWSYFLEEGRFDYMPF